MGTAEPRLPPSHHGGCEVSIRCREMGTAELGLIVALETGDKFHIVVARWGQLNFRFVLGERVPDCFYSLSRDGDSGTGRLHW